MTRISNLTTIKIGVLNSWNSYWFDKYYYSYLLLSDLKLKDYFTGIFYNLKIITDYIYIYRFIEPIILFKTSLIFLDDIKFRSISIKDIQSINNNFKYFYYKKYWDNFLYNLKLIYLFNTKYINLKLKKKNIIFLNLFYFLNKINFYFINLKYILLLYLYKYNIITNININNNYFYYINLDISLTSLILYYNDFIYNYYNFESHNYNISDLSDSNKNLLNYFFYYICSNYFLMNYYYMYKEKNFFPNLINLRNSLVSLSLNLLIILKYFIKLFLSFNNIRFVNIINLSNIINSLFNNIFLSNYNILYNYSTNNNLIIYGLRENITKSVLYLFKSRIEETISFYENKNIYFYFSLFLKKIPFLSSAKIITDILAYLLESGNKIVKSFFFIYNLQFKFYNKRRRLEYLYNTVKSTYKKYEYDSKSIKYLYHYASKYLPLIGIRIECNGTFKKGDMSKSYYYSSWVKNYILTGPMPQNTIIADIDYYQYFVILDTSSIGIKTWIFLETYLYDSNNIYMSIVY